MYVTPSPTRSAEPDQACAGAVELARAAAEQDAGPGQVGDHVGLQVEGDRTVTHLFRSLDPAYVGWRWAVTVTRAARARTLTVSESLLLPGPGSLLAPEWIPWTDRVRPGDLKAGDLMPASQDDERLVAVVAISGENGLLDWDETQPWSVGAEPPAGVIGGEFSAEVADSGPTGRETAGEHGAEPARATSGSAKGRRREREPRVMVPSRVLSAVGRDETAVRWHAGDGGPRSQLALAAPAACISCGFMVRLSGPLGRVFGVCANEYAPDDGKVVSVDHGCGAHSDVETNQSRDAEAASPTVDELGYDMVTTGANVPESLLDAVDQELA